MLKPLLVIAAATIAIPLAAQSTETAFPPGDAPIVVTGQRAEQAEAAGVLGQALTLKTNQDQPLARRGDPLCIHVFGIRADAAQTIADRIAANARVLNLPVGEKGCKPNAWIGFARDSKAEVAKLRRTEKWLFASMLNYEIDRIFAGSAAVQAWHAVEARTVEGRSLGTADQVAITRNFGAGRLKSAVRNDIVGSVVIFDIARIKGKSLFQLADYATVRILAPVKDLAKADPFTVSTILALFADQADAAPDAMTEFDWAYLAGLYRLDRAAPSSAMHDATQRAMLDGTATRMRSQSMAN